MTSPQPARQQGRLGALSLRNRVSLLYEGRRTTVLEEPLGAMRRAGLEPVVDPQHRYARARSGQDITIEVGFTSSFRVFGALIDTLWTGKHEGIRRPRSVVGYRFGRNGRFIPKSRSAEAGERAELLNADLTLRQVLARAELKDVHLEEGPRGRMVQVQPLPGTITALYFPPLPPYTVPIRPAEADAQLELLTRLLSAP
jgi:hypothetical protein